MAENYVKETLKMGQGEQRARFGEMSKDEKKTVRQALAETGEKGWDQRSQTGTTLGRPCGRAISLENTTHQPPATSSRPGA